MIIISFNLLRESDIVLAKVFGEEDEPIQSQGSGIIDTLDIPELANDLLELKQDGDNEQSGLCFHSFSMNCPSKI